VLKGGGRGRRGTRKRRGTQKIPYISSLIWYQQLFCAQRRRSRKKRDKNTKRYATNSLYFLFNLAPTVVLCSQGLIKYYENKCARNVWNTPYMNLEDFNLVGGSFGIRTRAACSEHDTDILEFSLSARRDAEPSPRGWRQIRRRGRDTAGDTAGKKKKKK
jgi:hypothetical protein